MSDEKSIDDLIAEAKARRTAAEARAKAAEPDAKVKALADELKAERAAIETEAAHKRTARASRIASAEQAAQKANPGAMVKGVDLYDLFPLGAEPANMPACGFTILRNPDPAASTAKDTAVQKGDRTAHEIGIDFVVACTAFPTTGEDAVAFRSFLESHAEAVQQLVAEVRDLGGAKSKARPMGRG